MLILVDCRPLQHAGQESERSRLIFWVLSALAREKGAKCLLLVDRGWQQGSFPVIPGSSMLVQRALPGRMGWRWWYDWQIPRLAKKHRPDWVMLTGGVVAAPLSAPQCIWMPVRADPKEPKIGLWLYARRLTDSLHRAESVFCFSQRDLAWLAARIPSGAGKLLLVRPFVRATAPLSAAEKERIKAEIARGKEFFFVDVADAGAEDVVWLLKAFSLFKKRQHSNMQLVMAGTPMQGLLEKLATYKYGQDVHWCSAADAGRVRAAAYAALLLFDVDSPGAPVLEAWAAGVPVLVPRESRLGEMAGNAALSAGAADAAVLAGAMMSVYKDEALRGRLIETGFSRLEEFGEAQTLTAVWAALMEKTSHMAIIK
jgi:glycosyltransferase involved in cell wall biosynthesis